MHLKEFSTKQCQNKQGKVSPLGNLFKSGTTLHHKAHNIFKSSSSGKFSGRSALFVKLSNRQMLERSLMILLFLTTNVMLCLMLAALYGEQSFLKQSLLLYLDNSAYHFLEWMIILCLGFFLSTTLLLAKRDRRERFFALVANFSVIGLLQFLMIIYASVIIDKTMNRYVSLWEDLKYSPAVAAAEQKMGCCGFYDTAMSVAHECVSDTPCGQTIQASRGYRIMKFLALTICSVILQGFNGFAVYSMKPETLSKKADFDGLIENHITD